MSEFQYKFDNAGDKLLKARCRLMTIDPFYGSMAVQMDWIESNKVPTMGVRITANGRVECYYNPEFVNDEDFFAVYAAIQHEIEHVIRLHCVRVDTRIPQLWNIAADMTINGTYEKPRIGYHGNNQERPILPFETNKKLQETNPGVKAVFIPKDWDTNAASEEFYDKLIQESKVKKISKNKTGSSNQNNGDESEGDDGQSSPSGKGGGQDKQDKQDKGGNSKDGYQVEFSEYGAMIGDHSIWNESEVSGDEARGIVKNMVQEAVSQNPGKVPGHLEAAIEALKKPIVRWRQLLRLYMGQHLGNSRVTFSRQNRRRPAFGNPGISHRAAAQITCIIDTSGSVSDDMLEQYFGEIESMAHRAKINVLQWDHDFQGYDRHYRKHGWKKFKINGRGGTDMVAPYTWLEKNRAVGDVVILLTDGYTPWPDPKNYPCIFCITTDAEGPKWGQTLRIKVQ